MSDYANEQQPQAVPDPQGDFLPSEETIEQVGERWHDWALGGRGDDPYNTHARAAEQQSAAEQQAHYGGYKDDSAYIPDGFEEDYSAYPASSYDDDLRGIVREELGDLAGFGDREAGRQTWRTGFDERQAARAQVQQAELAQEGEAMIEQQLRQLNLHGVHGVDPGTISEQLAPWVEAFWTAHLAAGESEQAIAATLSAAMPNLVATAARGLAKAANDRWAVEHAFGRRP